MLTHLGCFANNELLDLFREITSPVMEEAAMTPILKRVKNRKKTASYRPISLNSVVGKTMESIVNGGMRWYLETKDLLVHQQAGFRMFRSTENQIIYLAQDIEDPLQKTPP